MSRRTAAAVLFGIPALSLAGAFAWLSVAHGTLWMLSVVVHENGRYTLLQTILYFRHFLREVPIVFLYALVSVTAIGCYGPVATGRRSRPSRGPWLFAVALVLVAWTATVRQWGLQTGLRDLLQGYLTDDSYLYGSHWRAHVLSTVVYLAAATVLAMALARAVDGAWPERRGWIGWMRAFAPVLVLIAAASLVFRPSLDSFAAPRYVLHEAREAVTHGIVSLPLSFGVLMAAGFGRPPAADVPAPAGAVLIRRSRAAGLIVGTLMMGLAVAGAAFLLARIGHSPLLAGTSWTARIPAHVFEHTLDYVLLGLLSLGLMGVPHRASSAAVATA